MCVVAVFYLGASERAISFQFFASCSSLLACLLPVYILQSFVVNFSFLVVLRLDVFLSNSYNVIQKTYDLNAALSTLLREKVKKGLEKYIADAGFFLINNTCKLTRSKALSDNTENSYIKHYAGFLYQFAAKFGDYEGLLVLHESTPFSQVLP